MPALPSPLLSLLLALTPLSSSCQTVKSPGVERPASTGTDATAEAPAVSSPEASLEPVPELIVAPEPLDPEVEAYLASLASHETMIYDPVLGEESILIRPDAPPPGPWIEREETYARHIRARWLAQQGRHAEAEAIIREALAADPESITLNLSLAETLYAQGSGRGAPARYVEEAIATLRELTREHPEVAQAHALLGEYLASRGELREAAAELRRATEIQPRNRTLWMALAQTLIHVPDAEGAIAALEQVRSLQPGNLYALLLMAEVAQSAGRPELAIECFEGIIAARPDEMGAYRALGQIHEQAGNREAALDVYRRGLLIDPGSGELNTAVRQLLGSEDPEVTIAWWQEFVRAHPQNIRVNMRLVSLLLNQGEEERAVDVLDRLVDELPNNAEAHLMLGQLLQALGRDEEAADHLRRSLTINPRSTEAAEALVQSLRGLGRLEEAEGLVRDWPQEDERAPLSALLAAAYAQGQEWDPAERMIREAIRLEPSNATYRVNLLNLLLSRRAPDRGLDAALDAIEACGLLAGVGPRTVPLYAYVHTFGSAMTPERTGRARQVLTAAANRSPSDAAFRALGQFEYTHGTPEAARAALRRAWSAAGNPRDQIRILRVHMHHGDDAIARQLFDEALARSPQSPELRLWRGVMAWRAGDPAAARAAWAEAIDGTAVLPQVLGTLGALRAERWTDAGIGLALATIERFGIVLEQGSGGAFNLYQFIALFGEEAAREHFTEIERTLLASPATGEARANALAVIAQFYAGAGRPEQAAERFLEAARLDPADSDMAIVLSELARDLELHDTAVAILTQAIEHSPGSDQLHYFLGYAYDEAGRVEEAERAFRRALEINPDNYLALNHLGYMFTEHGIQLEEALTLTQRAVELSDEDVSPRFNNAFIVDSLGWAHHQLGNHAEAARWLREAIRRAERGNVQDGLFHEHLGDALLADGKTGEAIAAWEEAIQVYRAAGDLESAETAAEKILREQPANARIAALLDLVREEIASPEALALPAADDDPEVLDLQ